MRYTNSNDCSILEFQKDNCCTDIELSWNQQEMFIDDKYISPVGKFKKQLTSVNDRSMYYNKEKDIYIIYREQQWAVSYDIVHSHCKV